MVETFQLCMSHDVAQRIRRHGVETFPYECCGALLGRDSVAFENSAQDVTRSEAAREVLELFPLVNRRGDSPHNRFAVTAEDVRDAEKAATAQGFEVIGWYHSLPDHPTRPSDFDRETSMPWYRYVSGSVPVGHTVDIT